MYGWGKNMKKKQRKWGLWAVFVLFAVSLGIIFGSWNTIDTKPRESVQNKEAAAAKSTVNTAAEEMSGKMTVHFLDVGQGLSVLLESDGHYVLYDGGGPERSSYVVAYLKKQGVKKLDYLVASHYDMDHISGLVGVINVFPAETILGPDYVSDTDIYRSFMDGVAEKGEAVMHPAVGDTYSFGFATMEILAPLENYADSNECSLVIKVSCENTSMLLTGDASNQSENDMISQGKELLSDVLVVGHHGSEASTSEEFLEKVSPKYAVISCGSENKFRHPAQKTMERLKSSGLDMYRTDLQGTITAVFDRGTITWDQKPCGDYSGRDVDSPAQEKMREDTNTDEETINYVLNTHTLKFHLPSCHSVDRISPENRSDFTGTREEAATMGYAPCGNCKP